MTTILTPEQQEWVDALRYGDFKQGKGQLHNDNDEDCCLGVACHVSDIGVWRPINDNTPSCETALGYQINNSRYAESYILPVPVAARLNLRSTYGQFVYTDQISQQMPPRIRKTLDHIALGNITLGHAQQRVVSLANINDTHLSFADIADIIEIAADELFDDDNDE